MFQCSVFRKFSLAPSPEADLQSVSMISQKSPLSEMCIRLLDSFGSFPLFGLCLESTAPNPSAALMSAIEIPINKSLSWSSTLGWKV